MSNKINPEYITDEKGHKKAVILPIDNYNELLEDLEDLAVIAERRDEGTVSHEAVLKELRTDGLI